MSTTHAPPAAVARAWPPPATAAGYTRLATPSVDDEANLRFAPPDGAWAAAPAWRSRRHYLAALPWHPRLQQVCRTHEVAVDTFLNGLALYAARGDVDTGRNIAVANGVLARLLGVTGRHVRNITAAARELGVLQVVLAGTPMTDVQRWQVLDQYRRGHPSRRWRNLPNFAAATVPAELIAALHRPLRELRARLEAGERAARAAAAHWRAARLFHTGPFAGPGASDPAAGRAVDNAARSRPVPLPFFHLPEGVNPPGNPPFPLYEIRLFRPGCGQTPAQRAEHRTAAPRPTEKHHRRTKARSAKPLDPELKAFVAALKARLPHRRGDPQLWNRIQPRRLAQALDRHRRAGLTPADVVAGISTYLRAHRHSWLLDWEPGHDVDQARYLVALLTRADEAGYLIPTPA